MVIDTHYKLRVTCLICGSESIVTDGILEGDSFEKVVVGNDYYYYQCKGCGEAPARGHRPFRVVMLEPVTLDIHLVTPSHGTYTVMMGQTELHDNDTAPYDTDIVLEATPEQGYKFVKWVISRVVGTIEPTENPLSTDVRYDLTIEAVFDVDT